MIISASRRTDIPAFYADWFMARLQAGFVRVRNPMNPRMQRDVPLNPESVDGFVFWTKNPTPLLDKLGALAAYPYYFQFTLTAYQPDVETRVPSKNDVIIPAFQRLADGIGPRRVRWRYDPILLNAAYTPDYHATYFEKIARKLAGRTQTCTISFIDYYRCIGRAWKALGLYEIPDEEKHTLAARLAEIARGYGMTLESCAEEMDLRAHGIAPARCVDDGLLREISGVALKKPPRLSKDKAQRLACGCVQSVDIGAYSSCSHGCLYCYANHSRVTRGLE